MLQLFWASEAQVRGGYILMLVLSLHMKHDKWMCSSTGKFYQHLELKREWNELARKSAIPTSRSVVERIYPPLEPGEVSVEWSA